MKAFIKLVTNPNSETADKLQELLDGTCATMALRGNFEGGAPLRQQVCGRGVGHATQPGATLPAEAAAHADPARRGMRPDPMQIWRIAV